MRKKLLSLTILVLFAVSALNVNVPEVSAATDASIYIEPSSIDNLALTPGENFTVSIKTNYTGNDIWGYQFSLLYNPAVLEGVQAELANGDIITTAVSPYAIFVPGEFNNNTGELGLTYAYFFYQRDIPPFWPAAVASGPGTLANVTFTVVGKGSSDITLGSKTKLLGFTEGGYGDVYTIIDAEYHPDHIQDGYFDNRFQHDVAVGNVTAQGEAAVGSLVSINVTVANFGKSDEVANVTVRYDSTLIGFNDTVVIPAQNSTIVPFSWNTTGLAQRTYTINATATIPVDDDPTDNWNTTTFPVEHDVAVVSVTALEEAPVESLVPISVEVENIGTLTEVANVTVRYDSTLIGFNDTVMLPAQSSMIVLFDWDTTGVAADTYTINATATIEDDLDPTDNWNTTTIRLVAYDVAVVSVTTTPRAKAPVESLVSISVEVANEGAFLAEANVTISYDSTLIGFNDTVMLPAQSSMIVLFDWDTTGVAADTYTINATARLMNKTDTWTALGINKTDTWIGNGTQTTFITTQKPVVQDSEKVYVNQTLMTKPENYTIDYVEGNITFTTAPGLGANVTAIYLYLKKSFVTTGKPVVQDSEKVYVNQTLMTRDVNYTIDYKAGNITFTTAPGLGAEIKAIYLPVDMDPTDNCNTTTILIVEHDVAVGNVTAPDKATPGDIVSINVTVANIGAYEEMANVTICYDSIYIDSQNVTLASGADTTASFNWNTTGVAQGLYIINATATIPVDDDPTDNWNTTTILIAKHDVTVKSIFAPTSVDVGELVTIGVLVENLGWYNETFEVKVTVSYDTTLIETQTKNVTLLPKINPAEELLFLWNTTGVAPQSYTITAEAILDGDVNPIDNRKTDSVIVELPPGAIDGTVTDASTGDPIEGANVTVNGFNATTDVDGHYNITDVPAGTYTVTVSAAKHVNQSKTATVTSSTTTVLDFTLTPLNGTISGTVTESSTGDPVSGASVTANGVSVSTDADGSYSIELAPGTYNVTVSADGYESDSQSATVAAGKTSIVDFELTPTPSQNIPWQLYVAIAGVAAIVMVALAFYFLRIRKTKPK